MLNFVKALAESKFMHFINYLLAIFMPIGKNRKTGWQPVCCRTQRVGIAK
jgi:hypothetical protein